MRVISRLLAPISALLLAGSMLPAHAATHPAMRHVDLVLDWYPNSDHGGIYTAIQQGFLAHRRIDLTARVPSDTSAQISLVAAGHADFGISYETDLLDERAQDRK